MTAIRQDIDEGFFSGNQKYIRVFVKDDDGNPKSLTGGEASYVMVTDAGVIVVRKSSYAGISEIEFVDEAAGELVVKVTSLDSSQLSGTYRHQLNFVDSNGDEETVMAGKVDISKSYARRYRYSSIHAFLQGTA